MTINGSKTATMRKLILFVGMMVMLISLSAKTVALSPVLDDTSPPPEITADNTNQFQFDQFVIAVTDEAIPAPLISWGYNYETFEESSATTGTQQVMQFFLGPGDRFMSGRLAGQKCLSQKYATNPSAQTGAQKSLKDFIGPGSRPLLGTAEHNMAPDQDDDNEIGGNKIV